MICVTHDARDADQLANRLWYLDGAPAELQWDQPLSALANASASQISEQLRHLSACKRSPLLVDG
jgi:NitT/TauT family transport system ATP-binding protein